MTLNEAQTGKEYIVRDIATHDAEMDAFLFSLGCFVGESIRVITHLKGGPIVTVKDSRYQIDRALAAAIIV